MDDVWSVLGPLLTAAMCISVGIYIGASDERRAVAADCDRLGAFSVEDKVYKCEGKKQ